MDSIQNSWMNSPPHRANILNPNLNAVGFAVVQHGGYLYAVADFSRTVAVLSFDEVEAAVGKLLLAHGIQSSASVRDARQSCEMEPRHCRRIEPPIYHALAKCGPVAAAWPA